MLLIVVRESLARSANAICESFLRARKMITLRANAGAKLKSALDVGAPGGATFIVV